MAKANDTPSAGPQERDERICRERHAEKMDHMRRTIVRINDPKTSDEDRESLREEFANDVLSIEPLRALKITLSWGGPSDGYRLLFDKDGEEALNGVYWYADWFTYAETPLSREELQWVQDAYLCGEPSLFFQERRSA